VMKTFARRWNWLQRNEDQGRSGSFKSHKQCRSYCRAGAKPETDSGAPSNNHTAGVRTTSSSSLFPSSPFHTIHVRTVFMANADTARSSTLLLLQPVNGNSGFKPLPVSKCARRAGRCQHIQNRLPSRWSSITDQSSSILIAMSHRQPSRWISQVYAMTEV